MKTRHILLATTGTATALLLAAGIATADGRGGPQRGGHGEMHMTHSAGGQGMGYGMRGAWGHGAGGPMSRMMERYDTDGDGALTVGEVTAARTAQLGEFDADGDGSLSLEEYQALWLDAMHERMVDRFQQHDADGDGAVTQAEFARDLSRMVERGDFNGDGMMNAEDMQGRRHRMDDQDHPMGGGEYMRGGRDAE